MLEPPLAASINMWDVDMGWIETISWSTGGLVAGLLLGGGGLLLWLSRACPSVPR